MSGGHWATLAADWNVQIGRLGHEAAQSDAVCAFACSCARSARIFSLLALQLARVRVASSLRPDTRKFAMQKIQQTLMLTLSASIATQAQLHDLNVCKGGALPSIIVWRRVDGEPWSATQHSVMVWIQQLLAVQDCRGPYWAAQVAVDATVVSPPSAPMDVWFVSSVARTCVLVAGAALGRPPTFLRTRAMCILWLKAACRCVPERRRPQLVGSSFSRPGTNNCEEKFEGGKKGEPAAVLSRLVEAGSVTEKRLCNRKSSQVMSCHPACRKGAPLERRCNGKVP